MIMCLKIVSQDKQKSWYEKNMMYIYETVASIYTK